MSKRKQNQKETHRDYIPPSREIIAKLEAIPCPELPPRGLWPQSACLDSAPSRVQGHGLSSKDAETELFH